MTIAQIRETIKEKQNALLSYAKKTYPHLNVKLVCFHKGYKGIIAEMNDTSVILLSNANLSKKEAFEWIESQTK